MSEKAKPGRPAGARQTLPTKAEIKAAWDRLKAAANAGDVQACALMIALGERQDHNQTTGQQKEQAA